MQPQMKNSKKSTEECGNYQDAVARNETLDSWAAMLSTGLYQGLKHYRNLFFEQHRASASLIDAAPSFDTFVSEAQDGTQRDQTGKTAEAQRLLIRLQQQLLVA